VKSYPVIIKQDEAGYVVSFPVFLEIEGGQFSMKMGVNFQCRSTKVRVLDR
jgi:hypothetical protein